MVLAWLLVHPNTVVSADQLIDAVWGERPPATARASLHNVISELRVLLGSGVLERQPAGYLLRVEPEQVDTQRCQQLRRTATTEPPAERVRTLEQALALWRGRPLLDLFYEDCTQCEIRRLEDLRVVVQEELAEARLATGMAAELVAELQALVELYPYRETLRGLLIRALRGCGRVIEAAETYADWCETLAEWGVEPSRAIAQVASDVATSRRDHLEALA